MSTSVQNEPIVKQVDPDACRNGDIMALVYFFRVKDNYNGRELSVTDLDTGKDFNINGRDLIKNTFSADRFIGEPERITKTRAAEILISCHNVPFTVDFEKQDGDERTLRGRLIRSEP